MYKIYAGATCIFNDASPALETQLTSPTLQLSAGAAGSLSMTVPKTNAGYNAIQRLTTTIKVLRDGVEIWQGRVLSEERDLWNNKKLFCEGALAYLNDTIQTGAAVTGGPSDYIGALLTAHNAKAPTSRRIYAGNITVADPAGSVTRYRNGETTLALLQKLVNELGGVLRVRSVSGALYLDYLADYPGTATQAIDLEENLLDFTRDWDSSDFCTAILPRGARQQSEDSNQQVYLTINPNEDPGTGYQILDNVFLANRDAVSSFGRIEKAIDFSDIGAGLNEESLPQQILAARSQLMDAAKGYLNDQQFDSMTLELTAVDLHMVDPAKRAWNVLDIVLVKARPYFPAAGKSFAILGQSIPLDKPENTKYTLGAATVPKKRRVLTLTGRQNKATAELADSVEAARTAGQEFTEKVKVTLEAADTAIIERVEDDEGNLAALVITVDGIAARVTDAEGDISTIDQKANEIKAHVADRNGNYTVMTIDAQNGVTIGNGSSATNIDGGFLDADTVTAHTLKGQTIDILDNRGTVGSINTRQSSVYSGSVMELSSNNGVSMVAPYGYSYIYAYNSIILDAATGYIQCGASVIPDSAGARYSGTKYFPWADVWFEDSNGNAVSLSELEGRVAALE